MFKKTFTVRNNSEYILIIHICPLGIEEALSFDQIAEISIESEYEEELELEIVAEADLITINVSKNATCDIITLYDDPIALEEL